jgi:hypothetical protein
MSTYFAVFESLRQARDCAEELVRHGVRPDDLSIVTKQMLEGVEVRGEMVEPHVTVGDATSFVGREDDPDLDGGVPPTNRDVTDLTSVHEGPISPIDTSDKATNVDTLDQANDSQSLAEDMMSPPREISQSEHEKDDLALTLRTGFPTPVPLLDEVNDADGPNQRQNSESLETIVVPESGTIIGGGGFATAAFDVVNPTHDARPDSLRGFMEDEGVSGEMATTYVEAFSEGKVLMAVEVVPGKIKQGFVEEAVERWEGQNGGMFDAPRFYEGGGEGRAQAI